MAKKKQPQHDIFDINKLISFLPLFSTALIHFSTKLGTVVFSCAHSEARWHPNTFSEGNKTSSSLIVFSIETVEVDVHIADINNHCNSSDETK